MPGRELAKCPLHDWLTPGAEPRSINRWTDHTALVEHLPATRTSGSRLAPIVLDVDPRHARDSGKAGHQHGYIATDRFYGFEQVIGSDSRDNILGCDDTNRITDGAGNDYLNGNSGVDKFTYP
jgi:hypothetical protein